MFQEQGFEETTLAEIASRPTCRPARSSATSPARRTCVSTTPRPRLDLALRVMEGRRPDETVTGVLM
ncbi:hypothetical protein, partial [Nonomuraea rubra]|uniref:hypothetical protein n=1 Tax=Nonomuraea rubra TaxID=46180 RepID=UPI0031E770D9